jgi:rod shape-determining protein MreC
VTQVLRREFGIYQQVIAAPAVDFSRVEEVLIVLTRDEDPQAARDTPGAAPAGTKK